jgi:hypothetical protein
MSEVGLIGRLPVKVRMKPQAFTEVDATAPSRATLRVARAPLRAGPSEVYYFARWWGPVPMPIDSQVSKERPSTRHFVQAFAQHGVDVCTLTVMPQQLHQIAALAAEHEQVARLRIALQHFLNAHGEPICSTGIIPDSLGREHP